MTLSNLHDARVKGKGRDRTHEGDKRFGLFLSCWEELNKKWRVLGREPGRAASAWSRRRGTGGAGAACGRADRAGLGEAPGICLWRMLFSL